MEFGQQVEDAEEEPVDENAVQDVMEELIEEMTLGLCFEVHRACKVGTFFLDETDLESHKKYTIVEGKGVDVFGQVPMKKQYECVCPNCSRSLAASRFAPHLEKCMGMGRNSSRIASRRIANTGKKDSDNESEDNNEDNDWSYLADKKVKRLKKEKSTNSPRRSKSSRNKNGDIPSVGSTASDGSGSQVPPYEALSLDERKVLLGQICGVISEHTKKMCTRSSRCPQHTDEQRRSVRASLLGQASGNALDVGDDVIDIDTYDDGDSQALRDTLQWEAASNPSPADSTSTVNSTSSRKRKQSKHSKSKKSASKSSSRDTGNHHANNNGGNGGGNGDTSSGLYDFM